MVEWIFNCLVFLINTVIWLFSKVLSLIFSLLPNSPFLDISTTFDLSVSKYLPYLNWLLPIKSILSILFVWLGCMLTYYIYSSVMRWIKLM